MSTLTPDRIAELLVPYIGGEEATCDLYEALGRYLDLLMKWNARTNLTAIRNPEEIVTRHFGESLFMARHLGDCKTVLDYGSGAGFPGIPIQLSRPELSVTLAESQGKKNAFLREVIRELGLDTKVWAGRVEAMSAERCFDLVALRAVDSMEVALRGAGNRALKCVAVTGGSKLASDLARVLPRYISAPPIPVPGLSDGYLFLAHKCETEPS
jgi:16S rRNA (guanine527-N7)-methyltransferase